MTDISAKSVEAAIIVVPSFSTVTNMIVNASFSDIDIILTSIMFSVAPRAFSSPRNTELNIETPIEII